MRHQPAQNEVTPSESLLSMVRAMARRQARIDARIPEAVNDNRRSH
jgi:hypothetical protein